MSGVWWKKAARRGAWLAWCSVVAAGCAESGTMPGAGLADVPAPSVNPGAPTGPVAGAAAPVPGAETVVGAPETVPMPIAGNGAAAAPPPQAGSMPVAPEVPADPIATPEPGDDAPGADPTADGCPAGFDSDLGLVMSGASVPGNLDLGLALSPETTRNPCGDPEERACFELANEHRVAAGLAPFKWDGDLADLARSHSADRTQLGYYAIGAHGSSTQGFLHLYQERADFLGIKPGKFVSVVENAHSGPRSGAAVMDGFMNSSAHRDVIMGAGQWASLTHAACGQDGAEWNMEFGQAGW